MLLFLKASFVINPIFSLIFWIKKGNTLKRFSFEFPGHLVCEHLWEVLEFAILRLANALCHVEPAFNYPTWQLLLIVMIILSCSNSDFLQFYQKPQICTVASKIVPALSEKKKSLDYRWHEVNTFKEEILWRPDIAWCILIHINATWK